MCGSAPYDGELMLVPHEQIVVGMNGSPEGIFDGQKSVENLATSHALKDIFKRMEANRFDLWSEALVCLTGRGASRIRGCKDDANEWHPTDLLGVVRATSPEEASQRCISPAQSRNGCDARALRPAPCLLSSPPHLLYIPLHPNKLPLLLERTPSFRYAVHTFIRV